MPRPASDQAPIPHPIYPDHVRLYVDRKRRGNGVIEAQFKLDSGWTGYRVVGRHEMPDAMHKSMEIWARMKHGGDLAAVLPAGRPRASAIKPNKSHTDTFKHAALAVIKEINAELTKAEALYGRHSKKLDKYKKNVPQINASLLPYFGDMRCCNINKDTARAFLATYRLKDGTKASASTMGTLSALSRRVLEHSAEQGWRSSDDIPSLSKKGLKSDGRRPDVQPTDALRLMGHMSDDWCDDAAKQTTRWDRTLFRAFVAVSIVTGSRAGTELTEMRWKHITPPTPSYPHWLFALTGKTDTREVSPDESLIEFRSALAAAKRINGGDPETLVFSRPTGIVRHDNFMRYFAALRDHKDLKIKPMQGAIPLSLYSIRHYYATHLRRQGFSDHQIAEVMGTSPAMIHKYYGHIQPLATAKRIAAMSTLAEQLRNRLVVDDLRNTADAFKDDQPDYGPDGGWVDPLLPDRPWAWDEGR
jgi:integrase